MSIADIERIKKEYAIEEACFRNAVNGGVADDKTGACPGMQNADCKRCRHFEAEEDGDGE